MSIANKKILAHIAAQFTVPALNFALIKDLNSDGILDYLNTSTEIGSTLGEPVKLYISNSQGTYVDRSNLITGGFTIPWTQEILSADLNNDGLQDVVLGAAPEQGNARTNNGIGSSTNNHFSWGSPQYVLFQNKDGTFSPVQTISGVFEAHSVNVADFNNDGLQDILYVSDVNGSGNSQYPRLLLNKGDKSFKLADLSNIIGSQDASNTFSTFWATVGDFNNDNKQDIVFLNGGYQNGNFDFIAYGDGRGGFTKGPLLPMIPAKLGGQAATIEGSAVVDLNQDGYQDLIVWVMDRSDPTLGDLAPGHLMVMTNDTRGGFVDETLKWLGNFASANIGGDTRSLKGYLTGTSLIPLYVSLPVKGADNGYVQEPIFLNNTGTQLLPIYDPFWNSEILSGNGSNMWGSTWQMQNGQITTVYNDWNVNLVSVNLDPTNEASYYQPHNPFVVVNSGSSKMVMDEGFAFTAAKFQPYVYKDMPDWVKNTSRLLEENTPGNRVLIGTTLSDFISVGNDYAGTGSNVLIGNGGNDSLMGGSGVNKFIPSSAGNSYIYGGTGEANVYINGSLGAYTISTGPSATVISSNSAKYTIQNGSSVVFTDYTLNLKNGSRVSSAADSQVRFINTDNFELLGKNQVYVATANHTVLIKENSAEVNVSRIANVLYIADKSNQLSDITLVSSVPRLKFLDKQVAYDIDGTAGQAYRIYQAAFNRTPDNGGLKYWIGTMDGGVSLSTVSSGFIGSAEFQKLYGTNPTNDLFVSKLYDNVLHRTPDAGGYKYWVNLLNTGGIDKVSALVNFSESNENQAGVIGVIQNGIDLIN